MNESAALCGLPALEAKLGYVFQDRKLLETALTHSSYANEQDDEDVKSFERLEFLGDAVTGLEVALMIFERGQQLSEGHMTAVRAALVRTEGLAKIARGLGLGQYLRLGIGAEKADVRENDTVLEDAFEALMAAVFLDGGGEEARALIRRLFSETGEKQIRAFMKSGSYADFKSRLQIELQKDGVAHILYNVLDESGPDHDKHFRVEVTCDGRRLGTGEGKTKKHAEKMAAEAALEGLQCI
ncbi:MAG: ribonuclease III [Clostridiales Family XIII bacterium]|jgi:ribonuclease-3|nr:ribonuclease III [Clostridiales Family XIII bacterium]